MREVLEAICQNHQMNLLDHEMVHGGDINQGYRINTLEGYFFIKLNDAVLYPGMLDAEANGLNLISKTNSFRVPEVLSTGQTGHFQYLLLEWIPQGRPQKGFWENFGERLAQLHGQTRKNFGLGFNNYIGTLPQANGFEESFALFYTNQRIMPLVEKLYSRGDFNKARVKQFERFCITLPDLIPEEPPSLLHGDLWAGNYLVHEHGEPVLIDPAPYYGHRETDIAMSLLFGGFDLKMTQAYQDHFPLQTGWKDRVPIFQLYPLLVHAVLFGGGYVTRCIDLAARYS